MDQSLLMIRHPINSHLPVPRTGKKIDQEKLTSDILSAMKRGEYNKTITATADEVQPEITEAQARENS